MNGMIGKYEKGICSKCGKERVITQKSKKLCQYCQQASYHTPIVKKQQKPIPKFSEKGKKRKTVDIDFYHKAWERNQDWKGGCYCENCKKYLPAYSSTFVSHILTRGANPELSHDFDNVNILCEACHKIWDGGDRGNMVIYWKNQERIDKLNRKRNAKRLDG